jgi:Fe-S-cluster containining protein
VFEINLINNILNKDPGLMSYNIEEFVCLQCGHCCRGDGVVRITKRDARHIAAFLDITVQEFYHRYTYPMNDEYWLKDKHNKECIFLEDKRCVVHDAKPQQCKDYPGKWRSSELVEFCQGLKVLVDKHK